MKRLLFTAVAWGAVLLPMVAQAQRGMGFHGSSAPSGHVSGGFAARPAGSAARPMGRVAPARMQTMPARGFVPQGRTFIAGRRTFVPGSRVTFRAFPHHHFVHNHVFFNHTCFNTFGTAFPCVNPFLYAGIGYPGDPFYYNNYPSQPEQQPVVDEQDNGNRDLALEVQYLSDQIQAMRDRDEGQAREERRNATAKQAPQDDAPNATLIFRDGLQLSVRNYAISGDTIWVLDDHNSQKIPLAKLDVAATQKINDQNGVEFKLPH